MSCATRSRTGIAAMIESAHAAPLSVEPRVAGKVVVAVVVVDDTVLLVAHAPTPMQTTARECESFTATVLVRVSRVSSPVDRALLGGVHVLACAALEQERLQVASEEGARLGIHHVQAVMIDEH